MKTLMLMRHAKSSWNNPGLTDFERPLNRRGREASDAMAQWMVEQGYVPELIICSAAARTTETANRIKEAASFTAPIVQDASLYHAPPEDYWQSLRQCEQPANTILMLGHNPGMGSLLCQLSNSRRDVPTAALGVFAVDVEHWSDVTDTRSMVGLSELLAWQIPRELEP